MENIDLGKIADVSLGYTFRGSLSLHASRENNFFVLQAKDVVEGGTFVSQDFLESINPPSDMSHNAALQTGDIAFVYRTSPGKDFRASTLQLNEVSPVIATSSLVIIRVTDKNILPEYVTLYLNSSKAQKELTQIASGSSIISIPISQLRTFQIPLVSLEKQKKLADLMKNIQQQNNLLHQGLALRQKIKQDIITQITS